MNEQDQDLFKILRVSVLFYGFFLISLWIYSQLTNSWGKIWVKDLILLLIVLLIFSGSLKYILENPTLNKSFKTLKQYLEKHPSLMKLFKGILAFFKIKRKFRGYYLKIIFIYLLIVILWFLVMAVIR